MTAPDAKKKKQLHREHATTLQRTAGAGRPKKKKKKSVTRRTRDYVATNRWLGKGCSRKEQGGRHETPTPKGSNALKGYNMFNHSISPDVEEEEEECYTANTRLRRNEPLARERVRRERGSP